MIKAFALWRQSGKNGEYLNGNIGDLRILIFPNSKKEKDNQPDYLAYVDARVKSKEKAEEQGYKSDDGFKHDDGDIPF